MRCAVVFFFNIYQWTEILHLWKWDLAKCIEAGELFVQDSQIFGFYPKKVVNSLYLKTSLNSKFAFIPTKAPPF